MTDQDHGRRGYLDELGKCVLVLDGALGTCLQARRPTTEGFDGRTYEGCLDYLVISKPVIVERGHRSLLEVGADASMQLTNSSPSNRRRRLSFITRRRSTSAWVLSEGAFTYRVTLTPALSLSGRG